MRSKKQIEHCQKIATEKKEKTFDKVLTAILELLKEEKPLTLNSIGEKSGISTSWFYKKENSNLKNLIEVLNVESVNKANYLLTIETRMKRLESEIRNLKNS